MRFDGLPGFQGIKPLCECPYCHLILMIGLADVARALHVKDYEGRFILPGYNKVPKPSGFALLKILDSFFKLFHDSLRGISSTIKIILGYFALSVSTSSGSHTITLGSCGFSVTSRSSTLLVSCAGELMVSSSILPKVRSAFPILQLKNLCRFHLGLLLPE